MKHFPKLWNARARVLAHVHDERDRQEAKWGEQAHPDGTGPEVEITHAGMHALYLARYFRNRCDLRHSEGSGSWLDILLEEVFEAAAEADPKALREELIQVAAVAVSWVEDLDRQEH